MLIAARPGLSAMLRRASGQKPPELHPLRRRCLVRVVHVGRRGHGAIERRDGQHASTGKSAGRNRASVAPLLRIIALRSSISTDRRSVSGARASRRARRESRRTETSQNVSVRQPCITMWMAESGDVAERRAGSSVREVRDGRRARCVPRGIRSRRRCPLLVGSTRCGADASGHRRQRARRTIADDGAASITAEVAGLPRNRRPGGPRARRKQASTAERTTRTVATAAKRRARSGSSFRFVVQVVVQVSPLITSGRSAHTPASRAPTPSPVRSP